MYGHRPPSPLEPSLPDQAQPLVGSDDLAIREKLHDVLPFEDQDRLCMDGRRLLRRERAGNEEWKGEKKDRRNPALDGMQQLYIRSDCSDGAVFWGEACEIAYPPISVAAAQLSDFLRGSLFLLT